MEDDYSYKQLSSSSKKSSGFGKSVLIPFASGILGAGLVVGTCFGVPSIREKIFNNTAPTIAPQLETQSSSTVNSSNANLVSLSNYSDTSVFVANTIQPSVVGIKVEYTVNSIFSIGTSTASASGSGVIITEDGYILTNNHVVSSSSTSSFYSLSEATKITVCLFGDDTEYEAKIIGTDSETDLAVIKIDKTGLKAATLGDSSSVKVGEFAMAAGNPLGMQNSITCGVVSAVDRKVTDTDGKDYVLIQTDAAINSGNSGGALVNSKGEVIGINTLKLSGTGVEGMGFAIPINDTKEVTKELIESGKVKRPYIGIAGIEVDEAKSKRYNYPIGIYIESVEDFSAAQIAGLKVGDVIVKADGKSVATMDELNSIKAKHKIGEQMTLTISRQGNQTDITLTLTEQP